MASGSSEVGWGRRCPKSRGWVANERRGQRIAEMPTAAGIARPGVPRVGPARLLFRAPRPETRDPGHSTVLRAGFLAE